jgi:hypothetical protein
MDARVLQPISPTFTNDPDRDSSEVNTLPSICRYLTEVGRQRIPPNMLMSDIYKSTRQGGSECSFAVVDGFGTFKEAVTRGFGSSSSWQERIRILLHLPISMLFKDGGRCRTPDDKLSHSIKRRDSRYGQK